MFGIRMLAAAAALVFAGSLLTSAAPAKAQDTPWYMPQPWMYPQATGPAFKALPGYYGHNLRHHSYGSFSTGCYGDCGIVRGTVMTGSGVVLSRPVMVIYDPRAYQVVPRATYQQTYAPQRAGYVSQQPSYAAQPARTAGTQQKPLPQFSVQNGVRIIRPAPVKMY
jgi:hypothetical protein